MNTFGHIFRVSIFGESHGEEIGVVIDGVEPGIALSESDFAQDIARRRSGAKGPTNRTSSAAFSKAIRPAPRLPSCSRIRIPAARTTRS